MTYDEYNALKAWMIQVGQDGEWPLFLDVWVEHVVEDVATAHREGNKGSIEGPDHVPGAPELGAIGTIPMRDGEPGSPLVWDGRITTTDGKPLAGKVELWHADADGFYSQFAPGIPEWNLRGSFSTGPDGRFTITTIRPVQSGVFRRHAVENGPLFRSRGCSRRSPSLSPQAPPPSSREAQVGREIAIR